MENFENAHLKRFNQLITQIDAVYHDVALKLGISDSTLKILYTVCWCGGECLLSEITSGVSKQTINSALRKLEADNIVYLKAFEGRKKTVCLTEKGYDFVKDTVLRLIAIENAIFDSWSDEERTAYMELTKRYLSTFREKVVKEF